MIPLHLQLTVPQILGGAVALYGVLQAFKKAGLDAYITGRVAVAFNAVFAGLGAIVLTGKLDATTLFTAIALALAAAGIHGTVKTFKPAGKSTPGAGATVAALLLCAALFPLANCAPKHATPNAPATPWDVQVYNQIDNARAGYESVFTDAYLAHQRKEISDAEWRVIAQAGEDVHTTLLRATQAMQLWEALSHAGATDANAAQQQVNTDVAQLTQQVQVLVQAFTKAQGARPPARQSRLNVPHSLWRRSWLYAEFAPRG